MNIENLKRAFEASYGTSPEAIYFAPGRVNLIGEHTDYNGGYVFPCALSFGIYLLLKTNNKGIVNFKSLNQEEVQTLSVNEFTTRLNQSWVNYPLGVFVQFIKKGISIKTGFDILLWGNVPEGAGLSSSAALEVVTAFALNDRLKTNFDKTELAKIGQQAEHEFALVNCGIMDQFVSANGKKDHAIFLDCNTLQFKWIPIQLQGIKIVISNTHSPHKLDSGLYNQRVAECNKAVELISKVRPIQYLAQLTKSDFQQVAHLLESMPTIYKRAHHVVGEVQRTTDAVKALQIGDIVTFGQLMNESHVSLRDDYEVTGLYLDTLVEAAWQIEGVIGSRMTGGGFGGCTVSLVKDEAIEVFIEKVGNTYTKITGLKADFYIAEIGNGVSKLA